MDSRRCWLDPRGKRDRGFSIPAQPRLQKDYAARALGPHASGPAHCVLQFGILQVAAIAIGEESHVAAMRVSGYGSLYPVTQPHPRTKKRTSNVFVENLTALFAFIHGASTGF